MAKPEIGLSMLYCLNKPFVSLLKRLREVNVKHIELPDEGLHTLNRRKAKKLAKIAQTYTIDFVVHAPWAGINIATPSPSIRRAVLKRLEKSIILSGRLGCRLWLFHPGSRTGLSHFYPRADWQINLESIHALLNVAHREGVRIAIENTPEPFPSLMKSVEDFHRLYEDLDSEIGMVLDIAHANLNNQIHEFITNFSKRLVHIHASDNDGSSDQHWGLGYGNIDWKNVAKTLRQVDYNNLIMIESLDHIEESICYLRELFI